MTKNLLFYSKFYLTLKQKSTIIEVGIYPFYLSEEIMNIGISTGCLYPMLTEDCLQVLCELGFRSFEIFFNTFSELETPYLDKLLAMLNPCGAKVKSIHPFTSGFESFLLFSNYERRFWDGVRMYEMYFRTANYIGAEKVVLHGLNTTYTSSMTDSEYFRRFRILQETAARYNVQLLQENVNLFCSNSIPFIEKMIAEIPRSAGFVCDVKQAKRGGMQPTDMVRAMGNYLKHIHINDFSADNQCVLPGKGCFDFQEFFDAVKRTGFDGDVMIEVYRSSFDKIQELIHAQQFLQQFC